MTYSLQHSFICARDVRPRDVCRIPGTLERSTVTRVDTLGAPPFDSIEIHWLNNRPPTKIGPTMNIVRFGRKTKIAHAYHSSQP